MPLCLRRLQQATAYVTKIVTYAAVAVPYNDSYMFLESQRAVQLDPERLQRV